MSDEIKMRRLDHIKKILALLMVAAFFQFTVPVTGSSQPARPGQPNRGWGGQGENYEDSAFGIYGAYAPAFDWFREQAGFTDNEYWEWVDGHMANLNAHWTRSNLQLSWDFIEPILGQGYNWDNEMETDESVERIYAAESGVHWLGTFDGGCACSAKRNPLDYPDEFADFVRAAVERYDGDGKDDIPGGARVKYWQVENEIEDWTDGGRTVDEYAEFVRLVRDAALAADPDAKIVLVAATDSLQTDAFLIDAIELLAAENAFDALDLHHWDREYLWDMSAVPEYRALLDSLGLTDVEIWSGEHGTWNGSELYQSEEDQAASLIKRYVHNLNNGLDKLFWNNLVDWYHFNENPDTEYNSMGLITDGEGVGEDPERFNTERVAYWAYKMLSERIDTHLAVPLGAVDGMTGDEGLYGYAYQRLSDSTVFYILWSEDGEREVSLPVDAAGVQVMDMITDRYGSILSEEIVESEDGQVGLTVGNGPVLVTGQ